MQNRGGSSDTEVFRARGNVAIAIAVEFFVAMYIWSSCYESGIKNIITNLVIAVAISAANYATFFKPRVIFSTDGIEIFNPLSRNFVRWSEIDEIDARWCMTISTTDRTINVYGAPAPGRHRVRDIHESELTGMSAGDTGLLRPARSPKSDSGVAVHIALMWKARYTGSESARPSDHRSEFTVLIVGVSAILLALLLNLI